MPIVLWSMAVSWRSVFSFGLLLWAASTVALVATEDSILLPSVVLIGSFLVPVTAIFWFLNHDAGTELSPARLLGAFFVAGVLGLLASAAMETWLLPARLLPNVWVGLIEEAIKAAGVVVFARGLRTWSIRDGILLGTTVGLGFGAFEASGYTLTWGIDAGGFSVRDMISEEVLRAVIAPFCHGIWTGLFGAAWFAARGRVTWGVVGVYFAVAGLHTLWDAGSNVAIVATVLAAGTEAQRDDLSQWIMPEPSTLDPQWLYGLVQWVVMGGVAALGVWLVRTRWTAS